LEVVRVGDIPLEENPRHWLIEGLWGYRAVGLIGGAPKCCKSWLGLDMAVSVSSGTACLDRYPVLDRGPVLIYLAEDALGAVRERIEGLARHRGFELSALELFVITATSLRLDQGSDRQRLVDTLERMRPRLLLLDPLVRLHAINENDATEVAQLLSFIRQLQRRFELAVILVHHARKYNPSGAQAGQGLRGSGDLHAFGDSNLYLRRRGVDLILSMEHRAAAAPEPVSLELVATEPRAIHLMVKNKMPLEAAVGRSNLDQAVLEAFAATPLMTRAKLREKLAVNNERLGQVLKKLEEEGKLEHGASGWQQAVKA